MSRRAKWAGAELVQEVTWFLNAGISPELTAHELGMTPAAVNIALRRAGEPQLAYLFQPAQRRAA